MNDMERNPSFLQKNAGPERRRNLKVMTAYRGTRYHGFQRQENGVTVQQVLETALSRILNEPVTAHGCSRTDAGVHARQFCFHVKTASRIPPLGFVRGMNTILPEDVSILSCEDAPEQFHARFDCKGKEYVYEIYNAEPHDPFTSDLALHYRRPLDVALMRRAAKYFVGTHDFTSFRASGAKQTDPVRTVWKCEVGRHGERVTVSVGGDGFLYNMVRILVGTLLYVNEGKLQPEDIPGVLAGKNRLLAGRTAPACGLYLNQVLY